MAHFQFYACVNPFHPKPCTEPPGPDCRPPGYVPPLMGYHNDGNECSNVRCTRWHYTEKRMPPMKDDGPGKDHPRLPIEKAAEPVTPKFVKPMTKDMDGYRVPAEPYFAAVETTKFGDALPTYMPGELRVPAANPIGDEVEAMQKCYEALSTLPESGQRRAILWLNSALGGII